MASIGGILYSSKGDVLFGSGAGAYSRLGVGGDGQVLTADSTQTLGVKWASPAAGKYAQSMTSVPSAVTNTTTLTNLWVPSNIATSQIAVGSVYRLRLGGLVTTQNSSGAFTYRVKANNVLLLSVTLLTNMTTGQTGIPWFCDHDVQFYATGSSGSVVASGHAQGYNASGTSVPQTGASAVTTVDLSAAFNIVASIQMATAATGNSFQVHTASLTQVV